MPVTRSARTLWLISLPHDSRSARVVDGARICRSLMHARGAMCSRLCVALQVNFGGQLFAPGTGAGAGALDGLAIEGQLKFEDPAVFHGHLESEFPAG